VAPVRYQELAIKDAGEPLSEIRLRVNNAQMGAKDNYCAVKDDAENLLESDVSKLGLSARAYSRVLKVGRRLRISQDRKTSKPLTLLKQFSIGAWIREYDY